MNVLLKKTLPLFIGGAVAACNGATDNTVTIEQDTTTAVAVTPTLTDTTHLTTIKAPEGIYQVTLPCADCKGIEHTVMFGSGQQYLLEEAHTGNKKEINRTAGTWQATDSIIWLYKGQLVQARYTWKGDTLYYIWPPKNKQLPLEKKASALDNDVWRNKGKEGIELFAIGTEPFWNVEVDEQQAIVFQLSEWSQPLRLKPTPPRATSDSLVYHTANDTASLRITVYNRFCNDGMSDNMYTHEVAVIYNGKSFRGCGLLFKNL